MVALLMILIPVLGGLAAFFMKNELVAKTWALLVSLATLALAILAATGMVGSAALEFKAAWMSSVGSSFSIEADGMGTILCLLTAIIFPVIFLANWKNSHASPNRYFALMLLSQAGLMGVFLSMDALLFYFFWELALIPVYFLCSQWGGEKRVAVTMKFFLYTFAGSVLMLIGLLYVWMQTPDRSFDIQSFYNAAIDPDAESWVFWLLFIAFAIKMPVFPFHTWQPDTYEQAPTSVTMVLSAVMVKMGVFGVIRWLLPVVPFASYAWGDVVMSLSVTGIIYASLLAIRQDDLKRFVAYSSIAHVGLMSTAIFAETEAGMQGVMIQMFNHGINIAALWIVVGVIEKQFGTRRMSQLGGLASKAPALAILLVVAALANIALPLTNAFVGEFLMFGGIFNSTITGYNVIFMAVAGIGIILAAVYTLNMIQKVFFGTVNDLTDRAVDIRTHEVLVLCALTGLIFFAGVYPQPLLDLTSETTETILKAADVTPFLKK